MNYVPQQSPKELERAVLVARTAYEPARQEYQRRLARVATIRSSREEIESAARAAENAERKAGGEVRKTFRQHFAAAVTKITGNGERALDYANPVAEKMLERERAEQRNRAARDMAEQADSLLAEELELLFAAEVAYGKAHRDLVSAMKTKRTAELAAQLEPLLVELRASCDGIAFELTRQLLISADSKVDPARQRMLGDVPVYAERSGEFSQSDLELHAKDSRRAAEAAERLRNAAA